MSSNHNVRFPDDYTTSFNLISSSKKYIDFTSFVENELEKRIPEYCHTRHQDRICTTDNSAAHADNSAAHTDTRSARTLRKKNEHPLSNRERGTPQCKQPRQSASCWHRGAALARSLVHITCTRCICVTAS